MYRSDAPIAVALIARGEKGERNEVVVDMDDPVGRCIRPLALSAASKPRYLSSPAAIGLFTAVTALPGSLPVCAGDRQPTDV